MSYWENLEKSAEIAKDRQEQYGDIIKNFEKISEILEVTFGLKLTPTQIAEVQIATKLSRNLHKEKDDNTHDAINYMAIRSELFKNQ